MIHLFYPIETQELFTNRLTDLALLDSYKNQFLNGNPIRLALIGTRRIGKSTILFEFIKRNIHQKQLCLVYLNLQRLVLEPVAFAKSYIGIICKWFVDDDTENFSRYDDPGFCQLQLQKANLTTGVEYLYEFSSLLEQRNLNQIRILEAALNFPKIMAQISQRKIILILDEFQEIALLNNFRNLPEISGFLREIWQTHHEIMYILAGSYVRLMQNFIENPDSPFFGQIKPHYVSAFDSSAALNLIEKLLARRQIEIPTDVKKMLPELSRGHPFYIECLVNGIAEAKLIDDILLNRDNVQKILLLQLVNERSIMNFHLQYLFEDALGRIRGSTILHGILKILAKDAPLTLTGIANRLARKPGLIQIGLNELLKVDLINRHEKRYQIADPLLRGWIYFKYHHPEGAFTFKDQMVQEMTVFFREKFLESNVELGRANEFELYYFVSQNQGRTIAGVTLPHFKTLIKNYVLPDGAEIDLFARNDSSWVFELKWKNKLIGVNELKNLRKKIQVDRYVLISKKGFTTELQELVRQTTDVVLWGIEVFEQT